MSCIAILDTSCIIWDKIDYGNNEYQYLCLTSGLVNLIDVFQASKSRLLLRNELIEEIFKEFPFEQTQNHFEFQSRLLDYLVNIPAFLKMTCMPVNIGVLSEPVLSKPHFNNEISAETTYILSYLHDKHNPDNCYFTYEYLYGSKNALETSFDGIQKQCSTVFFEDEVAVEKHFLKYKKIFQHNPVHHNNNKAHAKKSKFRCYKNNDLTVPQDYLNRSIFDNNRFYFYDEDNRVYLVFFHHDQNFYHGHEETNLNKIPRKVRDHFNI